MGGAGGRRYVGVGVNLGDGFTEVIKETFHANPCRHRAN